MKLEKGTKKMNKNEILQQRAALIENSRKILEKAESEGRDLNDTELSEYNKMDSDIDALKNRADRMDRADQLSNSLGQIDGQRIAAGLGGKPKSNRGSDEYKANYEAFLRNKRERVGHQVFNALEVGTSTEGGYLVPEEFDTKIVESLQDYNDFRQYINVIMTGSDRNIPIEDTLGSAVYKAEEAAYGESDPSFGQKVIGSYKATRIVKVSEELLEDAFFDVFGYLARNFGKSFGLRQEQSIVAGSGSSEPNSLITGASDSGITFASETAITSDELLDVYHGLSRPYRKNAVWVLNDSTVKLIRKLKVKSGENEYVWRQGLAAGEPDMLLGRPVITSQYMPEAEASAKSIIFGDLAGYTWAERGARKVQRLDELYAANGQVGFRGYERHDGVVTDASAIVFADQKAGD